MFDLVSFNVSQIHNEMRQLNFEYVIVWPMGNMGKSSFLVDS